MTIEYEGHAAALNLKPLTALVLEGLLSPQMETVNMVNATTIAKARDIAGQRGDARARRTATRR